MITAKLHMHSKIKQKKRKVEFPILKSFVFIHYCSEEKYIFLLRELYEFECHLCEC